MRRYSPTRGSCRARARGGELVIEDTCGAQSLKLPAGGMIVYPGTSLHRVNPITRGSRWGCFFWTQSMIDDDRQRRALFEMDMSIAQMRTIVPDDHVSVPGLTACCHNPMRLWCRMRSDLNRPAGRAPSPGRVPR